MTNNKVLNQSLAYISWAAPTTKQGAPERYRSSEIIKNLSNILKYIGDFVFVCIFLDR